jgi:hypothetical protein
MNRSRTRARPHAWLPIMLLGAALQAPAQTIPVTTPRLPPRSDAATPAPVARSGTPPTPQSPGQSATPAGQAGFGQGTPQPRPYTGATAPAGAYASPAQAGYAPYGTAAPPPAPTVVPQRATAGNCRAQPTPDRQTLVLVSGVEALARAHLPLGEFRAQQVVHSPDGRWAVVYTKLRGAAQYAAMTIDLERCELQRVLELSAAGEDVRFDGDDAVLRLAGSERRVALRDGRVR